MKKWKLLAGLTLLFLLLLSVTAQADSSSYGVVFGAANVNLRSAPLPAPPFWVRTTRERG